MALRYYGLVYYGLNYLSGKLQEGIAQLGVAERKPLEGIAQLRVAEGSLDPYAKEGDATTVAGDQEAIPPVMSRAWCCVYQVLCYLPCNLNAVPACRINLPTNDSSISGRL